ncbi:MAG TPA: S9 family peptidase [Vicinamibacterales bacterium]|nr:S9 family peptidase [Vicinamibacterales bacterium]
MRVRVAIVAVVLSCVPLAAQSKRPMTVDDILDLVQVSAPRISPDGARVLYSKSELAKWKDNKRNSTIWIVDADGSNNHQFLSSDKDRSPAWSPDGKYVAFLSTRDQASGRDGDASGDGGGAQIWVIPVSGGEATKLTDHKGAIRSFEWSKDSASIFFVAEHADSDAEKAAKKAGDDAIYVDEDANGQERGEFAQLWRITMSDKKEQQVTHDDHLLIESFKPSPDGSKAALVFRHENVRNHQYKAEVAVVNVTTGALTTLTHNNAPEQNVQWSPEGKLISFLAPSDSSWDLAEEKLWLVPAEGGGAPRKLTGTFNGAIAQYAWSADGQSIVFGAHVRARGAAYRVNVANGATTPLTTVGDWSGRMESVSADGKRGVAVVSSPTMPGDIDVIDLTTGKLTAVTHANPHVANFALSQFKAITWKSKDGLEVEGMLWLPADYKPGTKLPLNLAVHGGPAGSWDVSFRAIDHVYTGMGWAVLEPNVRGSSSYGDALLRGNMHDIGGGDYQDLMTGVDKLIADGTVDPDHMGVTGWSYGGILGGWTLTQTTRFKAAVLGAMVADWASEYAMGFNHDVRLWYIGGTPWESPDAYRKQSSYSHIANVTTPTLLLHGERDTTDTIGQSMIYYQGLKDRGVPSRFIRFPREPHGFREPHHQRIRDMEQIAWMMKYARGVEWKIPERKDAAEPSTPKKTTDQ